MSDDRPDQFTRLNKLIADSGLASRRAADRLIEEGHVTVNGKRVFELGIKVDPHADRVLVDGKPLRKQTVKLYLLLNKPVGVLSTMSDETDRPNLANYLEEVPGRVFPVGRLDWNSEGLILLTNDGDFANKVMHPREEVTKTYLVKIDGQAKPEQIAKLIRGVSIIGGRAKFKECEKVQRPDGSDQYDWYKVVITEGKNRQIRQMFTKIGFDVMKLQRVAIGRLRIGSLKKGELVYLNDAAVAKIFESETHADVKAKRAEKAAASSKKRGPSSRSNPFKGAGPTNRPTNAKAAGAEGDDVGPRRPRPGTKSTLKKSSNRPSDPSRKKQDSPSRAAYKARSTAGKKPSRG